MVLGEEASGPCGPNDVRVRVRSVSLNHRDLLVLNGAPPFLGRGGLIPVSDGAGDVIEVGAAVRRFQIGDRVVAAFRQDWIDGRLQPYMRGSDLGGLIDGMLAEQRVLAETGLVGLPRGMSYADAACLPCAGVTAWSAVIGGRRLAPGDTVLTIGSGGVSMFAIQFARMAGCEVIAVTSDAAKVDRVAALGAKVIRAGEAEAWDEAVLERTGGVGVDKVIEVGGPGTLERSIRCMGIGAEVAFVGLMNDVGARISPMPLLPKLATIRGVAVGSRVDLQAAMRAMALGAARPVIDKRFVFEDAPQAFAYLRSRAHVGKVVIDV